MLLWIILANIVPEVNGSLVSNNVGSMRFTLPLAPYPGRALSASAMDSAMGIMKVFGGKNI